MLQCLLPLQSEQNVLIGALQSEKKKLVATCKPVLLVQSLLSFPRSVTIITTASINKQ